RTAKFPPVGSRREPAGAPPVVEHSNRDAGAGLCRKRLAKPLTGCIVVDDVTLEVNRAPRRRERAEPRGIILGRVPQHAHTIALSQRRVAGAPERLIEKTCRRLGPL